MRKNVLGLNEVGFNLLPKSRVFRLGKRVGGEESAADVRKAFAKEDAREVFKEAQNASFVFVA